MLRSIIVAILTSTPQIGKTAETMLFLMIGCLIGRHGALSSIYVRLCGAGFACCGQDIPDILRVIITGLYYGRDTRQLHMYYSGGGIGLAVVYSDQDALKIVCSFVIAWVSITIGLHCQVIMWSSKCSLFEVNGGQI